MHVLYQSTHYITSSASATINDDNMATVTISSLQCEETYSITAGGIITTGGMMGQTLDGPRFHTEIVPTASCTIMLTTTLFGKNVTIVLVL